MVLLHHILCNLAIAAIADFLHRVAPRGCLWSSPLTSDRSCYYWHGVVCAVRHDLAVFCADFHSICTCSVNKLVGKVFKFAIPASPLINVVGELYIAYGRATYGDWCVMVVECFLHDLH